MTIHNSAQIDSSVILGKNVSIGPYSILESNVTVGDHTEIGSHVLICANTVIGSGCRIFHGAAIGGEPQIVSFKDVSSSVEIGDGTVIREYVTIHRGAKESQKTKIGKHCLLMNYVHIAHDCEVGDHVIIVNYTGLSGHVLVEDHAFVSGQVGVHQFVRIGKFAMVGGESGHQSGYSSFFPCRRRSGPLAQYQFDWLETKKFQAPGSCRLKKSLEIFTGPRTQHVTGD